MIKCYFAIDKTNENKKEGKIAPRDSCNDMGNKLLCTIKTSDSPEVPYVTRCADETSTGCVSLNGTAPGIGGIFVMKAGIQYSCSAGPPEGSGHNQNVPYCFDDITCFAIEGDVVKFGVRLNFQPREGYKITVKVRVIPWEQSDGKKVIERQMK